MVCAITGYKGKGRKRKKARENELNMDLE